MRYSLRLCLILMILHSLPVAAGVVEDAEEELKKIRAGQGQAQSAPSYSPPPYPSRPAGSSARPRQSSVGDPGGSTASSPTSTERRVTGVQSSRNEVEELAKPPRVITQEDKKGYFFSFLFIVLFAVLIALASLFGRRVETEE